MLNLYYYSNQYEKIKHILDELNEEKIETSSSLCNIKAHYLHYEGKHKEAAFFYNKAFNLSKKEGAEQGLFALNAAREYETAGDEDNAILSYIEASNMFLKTKQYVDLGQALNSLEHLAKDDERYLALSAKFYYAIEEYDKANVYLELLIKKNSKDADVWYLYALILEIKKINGSLILVTNEVGSSIVPMHPVSRAFSDIQGIVNAKIAELADEVVLCVCGLPIKIKDGASI